MYPRVRIADFRLCAGRIVVEGLKHLDQRNTEVHYYRGDTHQQLQTLEDLRLVLTAEGVSAPGTTQAALREWAIVIAALLEPPVNPIIPHAIQAWIREVAADLTIEFEECARDNVLQFNSYERAASRLIIRQHQFSFFSFNCESTQVFEGQWPDNL
jgi:hypothetical protein